MAWRKKQRTEKQNNKKETEGVPYYDEELLKRIAPAGDGRILHYETYSRTGTGYESCIHIWDYPGILHDYWLTKACSQPNTVTTISIHTEDQAEVRKNLNKSIEEQGSRKTYAREWRDFYDAEQREKEMTMLYDEITSMDEVVKSVVIRIFTAAGTLAELEEENARIISSLEADSYRAGVFLNESAAEWRSVYLPYAKQMESPHALSGFPMKSTLLADGNAFHFSSLEDRTGDFLGVTGCGGNVIFDEFTSDEIRVSYSAAIIGNPRFGKSTLLKNRLKARALRGDFIRTFDITGEFSTLTRKLGGRVLNMDGTDGKINLLEIFRSGETEHTSYTRHLGKLKTSYCFLNPEVETQELNIYIEELEKLYFRFGLLPDHTGKQVTGLPAKQYPVFSDLLDLLEEDIRELENGKYNEQQMRLVGRKMVYLDNIRSQIRNLVNAYGYLFDGATSVDNMNDVQIVTYNLTQLKDLDQQIFDLQLFNTLSLCWDGAITNGALMKKRWESGELPLDEVVHTLIFIDESHRWVNAKKPFVLQSLGQFIREGPKYFVGIWLASQSIRDYTPEGSTAEEIDTLKNIFDLTQYKFIFHQDANVIPLIDRVFNNSLTYSQREQIPRLQRGETILCISGLKNIQFKVYLSEADEKLFEGGA